MVNKKPVTSKVVVNKQVEDEDDIIDFGDNDIDLDELLREFEQSEVRGLKINVHEMEDDNGRSGTFLFFVDPGIFTMESTIEKLRTEYGTGRYRVSLRQGGKILKGGTEIVKIKLSAADEIAFKRRLADLLRQPPQHLVDDRGQVLGGQKSEVAMLLDRMEKMQSDQLARQNDRLIEALAGKGSAEKTDITTIIDAVSKMNGMVNGGGVSKSDNSLDQFFKFIEMYKTISGEGGNAETPAGVVSTLVKEMSPLLKEFLVRKRAAESGSSERVVSVQSAQSLPSSAADPGQKEFDFLVGVISRAAANDSEPAVYGQLLIDQLGEAVATEYCGSEANFAIALTFFPAEIVADNQEWFAELRKVVVELLGMGKTETGNDSSQQGKESPH